MSKHQQFADQLHAALSDGQVIAPLIKQDASLTIDDAYAISLEVMKRRTAEGEVVIGKKIGVTSKVVQDMLGVDQPDFGFMTDRMLVQGDIDIAAHKLIAPRAEAEIAFVLKSSLKGPGVTEADVLAATEKVVACFEVVDSRIKDWKIGIVDTVADNASCGVFVLGDAHDDPDSLDLPNLKVVVKKNGAFLSEGYGSAVQGSPLTAVAWLANTLGAYGVTLDAGDVILSGSLVPLADAVAGDVFEMELDGVGRCVARFI
ncbi:fumarylacetoacetate hydrolase family protein [Brevundimonas sp.]|uniref:fumarylacetoacetate hydrolase family protein n=1 Tax=Brevundimonas sp. TaxID=1871086 RepID=UPI002FC71FE7